MPEPLGSSAPRPDRLRQVPRPPPGQRGAGRSPPGGVLPPGGEARGLVRGKRWPLLRCWTDLARDERATLRDLFALNRWLAKAYLLKEHLSRLWTYHLRGGRAALPRELASDPALAAMLRRGRGYRDQGRSKTLTGETPALRSRAGALTSVSHEQRPGLWAQWVEEPASTGGVPAAQVTDPVM